MGNLTKNFGTDTDPNLCCPCCGQFKINTESLERLQELRNIYNHPIGIVEGGGYRCEAYGGSTTSAHFEGRAFDLAVPKKDLYLLIYLATNIGFTGVGVKNHGGRYQLHIDDAEATDKRPRPWVWTYG